MHSSPKSGAGGAKPPMDVYAAFGESPRGLGGLEQVPIYVVDSGRPLPIPTGSEREEAEPPLGEAGNWQEDNAGQGLGCNDCQVVMPALTASQHGQHSQQHGRTPQIPRVHGAFAAGAARASAALRSTPSKAANT